MIKITVQDVLNVLKGKYTLQNPLLGQYLLPVLTLKPYSPDSITHKVI